MLVIRDSLLRLPQYLPALPASAEEFASRVGDERSLGYDAWVSLPRRYSIPIRASLTMLMIAVVVLEGVLHHYGMAASDALLLALVGLVGGAVAGDTVRPAGMAPASKAKPLAEPMARE